MTSKLPTSRTHQYLGAGVQSSVPMATQHPRFVHPCFLHEQSSSHDPNKITKQHKVNRKNRQVWGACSCDMLSRDWTLRFARISGHVSTQLGKSRPAHRRIAFFENDVISVQISGRKGHEHDINVIMKHLQQLCRKPGDTALCAVWPTAPKLRPLSIIIPNRRRKFVLRSDVPLCFRRNNSRHN